MPYGAGFVFCDYFLMRAANDLRTPCRGVGRLSVLLDDPGPLLLGVLLTPDTVNSFFNWSHNIAGAACSSTSSPSPRGSPVAATPTAGLVPDRTSSLVAAVLAMLSDFHVVYYLSEGILVFQLFFSALLVYAVARFLAAAVGGAFEGSRAPRGRACSTRLTASDGRRTRVLTGASWPELPDRARWTRAGANTARARAAGSSTRDRPSCRHGPRVETMGIEPTTSGLQSPRSTN